MNVAAFIFSLIAGVFSFSRGAYAMNSRKTVRSATSASRGSGDTTQPQTPSLPPPGADPLKRGVAAPRVKTFRPIIGMATEDLVKEALLFLRDGNFDEADRYLDQALIQNNENFRAHLGKLMVELKARSTATLVDAPRPLEEYPAFQRALRLANGGERARLEEYVRDNRAKRQQRTAPQSEPEHQAAPKQEKRETAALEERLDSEELVRRAFTFLGNGDFDQAGQLLDQALPQNPKDGRIYLGKLMVQLGVRTEDELANSATPLDGRPLFQMALQFAAPDQRARMMALAQAWRSRVPVLANGSASPKSTSNLGEMASLDAYARANLPNLQPLSPEAWNARNATQRMKQERRQKNANRVKLILMGIILALVALGGFMVKIYLERRIQARESKAASEWEEQRMAQKERAERKRRETQQSTHTSPEAGRARNPLKSLDADDR